MTDTDIVPLLFEGECLIRLIWRDGEPWFVAVDVCRALGVLQPVRAVEALDDDEKDSVSPSTVSSTHGGPDRLIISESGLYTLILRSRQATTPGSVQHRFRKWVTGEVLPQIRRTGTYVPTEPREKPRVNIPPESMEESDNLKLRKVAEVRQTFGTRAAGELWLKLGLERVPSMFADARQADLFAAGAASDERPN